MGCPHLIRDLNFCFKVCGGWVAHICFMVQILIESTTGQVVRHRQSGSHSSATQRGRSAGILWCPFYSPSHSWTFLLLVFSIGFATGAVTVVFLVLRF